MAPGSHHGFQGLIHFQIKFVLPYCPLNQSVKRAVPYCPLHQTIQCALPYCPLNRSFKRALPNCPLIRSFCSRTSDLGAMVGYPTMVVAACARDAIDTGQESNDANITGSREGMIPNTVASRSACMHQNPGCVNAIFVKHDNNTASFGFE